MISHTSSHFRRDLRALSEAVQRKAAEAYRLFRENPEHPSLHFKKLPPHDDIYSVRITKDYRAVGRATGDEIIWFFIGSHADYDRLIDRL